MVMTRQEADDRQMSTDEAARLVSEDPALGAGLTHEQDNDEAVDDDATTPDRAVSNDE
jgi:hypothetical protein